MGLGKRIFCGVSTGMLSGLAYRNLSMFMSTYNIAKEHILYKAPEITPQIMIEANRLAEEIAFQSNGKDFYTSLLQLGVAGLMAVFVIYEERKDK